MKRKSLLLPALAVAFFLLAAPQWAMAHCDTLDGPVVEDARTALDKGEVTPVLKWVSPEDEEEISSAFSQALAVRKLSPEAKALADRYFFETLVRVHRAGEGAPYTGLKPGGTVPKPIAMADQALEKGEIDGLVGKILEHTEEGIRHRFQKALETKKAADENVDAGRDYVHAYVEYIHYVEGIVEQVHGKGHAH